MKEQVLTKYGRDISVYEVRDIDAQKVGEHQLQVRVGAFAINPVDVKTQYGESKLILPMAPPFVPGVDLAGTVEAVGSGVSDLKNGDRVFSYTGMDRMGAFTQRIVIDANRVGKAPISASMVEAASLPLPALCAMQALESGQVTRGSRVLIHGGAGAVGSMAVQLAAHLGAHVTVTASAADADRARALGASGVIDYRTERFEHALRDLTCVFDTVGGDTLKRSFQVLKQGGRLVTLHSPPDADALLKAGLKAGMLIRLVVPFATMGHRRAAAKVGAELVPLVTVPDAPMLGKIAALVDAGALKTMIDSTFTFEQLPEALTYFTRGTSRGRVVVVAER